MIDRRIGRADQLQFLRFCAFGLIFLWHMSAYAFDWFPGINGAVEAVSFFFILSGLVTGYSSYGKDNRVSLESIILYMKKKICKVYPLYFCSTIFSIIYSGIPLYIASYDFNKTKLLIIQLLKNLVLIQSWFPVDYFSFNGVGWFLSTIIFLWFLNVPAVVLLNKIDKIRYRYFVFGSMFVLLQAVIIGYCYCLRNLNMQFWEYVFPPSRLGEYLTGMITGFVIRSFLEKMPDTVRIKIIFTCLEIISLFVWIYALYLPIYSWHFRIVHWIAPNLFVLCVFTFGKGYISTIFKVKFLKKLGDGCFEYFLLHQVLIGIYNSMSGGG